MSLDGTYTAILDRFEDDLAVLEVSDGDDRHELVVDRETLPEDGQHPDAVFEIEVVDDDLQAATYDEADSERRQEDAQSRFDRLSSRPPDEDEESG